MAESKGLTVYLKRLLQKLSVFLQDNNGVLFDDIARRAFVNNAFDGALTILGILMGNIILGEVSSKVVIGTGLSACLAMGMSGSFGRYLSERAEKKRALHQIESHMFTDLNGSLLERESEKKVLLTSLVDGLSPAIAAAVPLIPFGLVQAAIIPVDTGVIVSLVLDFSVLFVLGFFLGRVSDENPFIHGVLVVAVGFITSLIIFLTSSFLIETGS